MPKPLSWLACLSLVLLLNAYSSLAQSPNREAKPRNCSISGRVTIKGKPAINATVLVTAVDAAQQEAVALGQAEAVYAKAVTDGEGRYQFLNLPPGEMLVRTLSRAYVATTDAQDFRGRMDLGGRLVSLRSGDQHEGIDFDFVRGGVITGRVTESGGRPLPNEFVNLMKLDEEDKPQPTHFGLEWSERQTDDRGIYRLFGLPAGRYVVSAGTGRLSPEDNRQEFHGSKYALRFHPTAAQLAQAKVLEVTEGSELTNIDLQLVKGGKADARRTFAAKGRVLDAETGQPVAQARLNIYSNSGRSEETFTDAQGLFQLDDLASGMYQLHFRGLDSTQQDVPSGYDSEPVVFEITEAAAEGIEMRLQRGATITGVVVIEGQRTQPRDPAQGIAVINANAVQDPERPHHSVSNHAFGYVKADGQFKLVGLKPGRVKFNVDEMLATASGLGRLGLVRIERNGVNLGDNLEVKAKEQITGVRVITQRVTGVLRGQISFTGAALPKDWTRHWRLRVVLLTTELAQWRNRGGSLTYDPSRGVYGVADVDEAGGFEVQGLLAGSFELSVEMVPLAQNTASDIVVEIPFEEVRQTVFINAQGETNVTVTLKVKAGRQQ